MIKLTSSQLKILWSIANKVKYYGDIHQDDQELNNIENDIIFLKSIGLIESSSCDGAGIENLLLLPDGMLYLAIDSRFVDMNKWISLVNLRIEKNNKDRTIEEMMEYYYLSIRMVQAKRLSSRNEA